MMSQNAILGSMTVWTPAEQIGGEATTTLSEGNRTRIRVTPGGNVNVATETTHSEESQAHSASSLPDTNCKWIEKNPGERDCAMAALSQAEGNRRHSGMSRSAMLKAQTREIPDGQMPE